MKASILDLRRRMSDILKALDKNETITLTYRGKKKATIVPVGRNETIRLQDHPAFGLWADREDMADVAGTVRTMRRGRTHAV